MLKVRHIFKREISGSLDEIRCPKCHRLLGRGDVVRLEIVCPKCRGLVVAETAKDVDTSNKSGIVST